jgi:hypothetical protein
MQPSSLGNELDDRLERIQTDLRNIKKRAEEALQEFIEAEGEPNFIDAPAGLDKAEHYPGLG